MEKYIHESGEDYIEAILRIHERKGYVRSVDIAETLGVTKPSVSRAVKLLAGKGLIDITPAGITLTDKGQELAEAVFSKHKLIRKFFTDILGVSDKTAEADACRVEHALSEETYVKLKEFIER
ncbi:MAG: metal-dependent transcriptional regulator [Ruminococcus sp.]|nr:metal-dependent transcriptional regulator [Ruminococcus sp.]